LALKQWWWWDFGRRSDHIKDQSIANSAPTEQVIAQVNIGDRSVALPSAPLVCEILFIGAGWESVFESDGPSDELSGVNEVSGPLFAGISGGFEVVSSGAVAVASGAGTRLEADGSGFGLLGAANLQLIGVQPLLSTAWWFALMISASRASMGIALTGPGMVQRRTEADHTKMAAQETRRETK